MSETTMPNPSSNPKPAVAPSPSAVPENYYPRLIIHNNEHPSKLFAIPFLGIFIRFILSIPLIFIFFLAAIMYLICWIITPFVILFTGTYWEPAYKFTVSYLTFYTKVTLYIFGLTDKYPGFNFSDNGIFKLHIDRPVKPSRFLAFPALGILIRAILMIPYRIYENVLGNGVGVAIFCSWFSVLIKGKYPESLYEFNRDYIRVYLAQSLYMSYLSDTYPSFNISMKHKQVKITLIVLGALLMILGTLSDAASSKPSDDSNVQYDTFQKSVQQPRS